MTPHVLLCPPAQMEPGMVRPSSPFPLPELTPHIPARCKDSSLLCQHQKDLLGWNETKP